MFTTDDMAKTLNKLIENPEVRRSVAELVAYGVRAPETLIDHPTVMVNVCSTGVNASLGFLGLLNGVLRLCGQHVLVAHYDSEMKELLYFSSKFMEPYKPERHPETDPS